MTDSPSRFSRTRASATRNKKHAPTARKIFEFILFYEIKVVNIQDRKVIEKKR